MSAEVDLKVGDRVTHRDCTGFGLGTVCGQGFFTGTYQIAFDGFRYGEDARDCQEFHRYYLIKENKDLEPQKDKQDPFTEQVGGGHYKGMKIQPVEFILANELGFCEGNAIKYICRYKQKGGVEDLKKVIHYAQLLIADLEKDTK